MKKLHFILVALMFIAAWYFLPSLPDMMPMHWNIRGEVDNYMPKNAAVWYMPILTVIILAVFRFIPLLDPKKDKYKLFKEEWEIIQTAFIGFFGYMQFLTIYISLNPETKMMPLMFIGLGILFALLGNYMSKIRQNYFIGVRTPWTLSSEENWNKTHRFASWSFVAAGIITLIEAFFMWNAPVIVFGSIILGSLSPVIYSYMLFRKSNNSKRKG